MHPDVPLDPELRHLEVGAHPLSYTDSQADGPAIVTLHGLPGGARDFRWLEPALHPDLHVLRLELPGYGASPRHGFRPMPLDERVACVLDLLDALSLERVTLVTHSAGAIIASALATTHPDRIERVVFLAPAGPTPHFSTAVYAPVARALQHPLGRLILAPIQRWVYTVAGFPSSLTDAQRAFTTLDASALDFERHRRDLSRITQPTLVAWAQDDRIIPASRFEALEALVPNGPRLRFESGGHNIQKTQATEIGRAISTFVGYEPTL